MLLMVANCVYMASCEVKYRLEIWPYMSLETQYRKILKISPGAYIFLRPFLKGLSTGGNLHFKVDWASLIVVFEGNFPGTSTKGAYIWRGNLTEGFLPYQFGGLIFGGA